MKKITIVANVEKQGVDVIDVSRVESEEMFYNVEGSKKFSGVLLNIECLDGLRGEANQNIELDSLHEDIYKFLKKYEVNRIGLNITTKVNAHVLLALINVCKANDVELVIRTLVTNKREGTREWQEHELV